jgi:hypothetical protein
MKSMVTCVNSKDSSLGLLIRHRELDLSVDTPGANEGGVQCLDPVGRHNHLVIKVIIRERILKTNNAYRYRKHNLSNTGIYN